MGILSSYICVVIYYGRSLQQIGIFISVKSDIHRVVNEKYEFSKRLYGYIRASVLKKHIVY